MLPVLKKLSFACVVGYAVLVVGSCSIQRSLIYHPSTVRPDPISSGVAEMGEVSLTTTDGLKLLAWWARPKSPDNPVIVFFHGNAGHIGNRASKVRNYLTQGWGVLLVAWRGYSGNPGSPTEAGLYEDGRAALRFLEQQKVGGRITVLYGESLGTGVAVQLATETDVRAVVLEAPYSSIVDAGRLQFPFLPVDWLLEDRFDSRSKINRINAPVLIIHGSEDRVIPIELGKRLFSAAVDPKKFHVIEGGGHNNLYEYGAATVVSRFISANNSK